LTKTHFHAMVSANVLLKGVVMTQTHSGAPSRVLDRIMSLNNDRVRSLLANAVYLQDRWKSPLPLVILIRTVRREISGNADSYGAKQSCIDQGLFLPVTIPGKKSRYFRLSPIGRDLADLKPTISSSEMRSWQKYSADDLASGKDWWSLRSPVDMPIRMNAINHRLVLDMRIAVKVKGAELDVVEKGLIMSRYIKEERQRSLASHMVAQGIWYSVNALSRSGAARWWATQREIEIRFTQDGSKSILKSVKALRTGTAEELLGLHRPYVRIDALRARILDELRLVARVKGSQELTDAETIFVMRRYYDSDALARDKRSRMVGRGLLGSRDSWSNTGEARWFV
jgi:hypothetical protein